MKAFIERNVQKRLGALEAGGFEKIKTHPYFSMVDWVKLENKELTPPFIPDSKRANFDATHELEELLLEDNPLKAKPRKKDHHPDDQPLSKEQKMMEEQFEVFNYEKERKNKINIATNDLGNPLSEEQLRDEHEMTSPSVNGGTSVDIKTTTSTATHTHTHTRDQTTTNDHETQHTEHQTEITEPIPEKENEKKDNKDVSEQKMNTASNSINNNTNTNTCVNDTHETINEPKHESLSKPPAVIDPTENDPQTVIGVEANGPSS